MFDKLFEDLQSQVGEWVASGLEDLGKTIYDKWAVPEPNGQFEQWQKFSTNYTLVSRDCISIEGNSWKIGAYEQTTESHSSKQNNKPVRKVQLFSVGEPPKDSCVIACRALIKTMGMSKNAELKLGLKREAELFGHKAGKTTQYYRAMVLGSEWKRYEVRHYFKKEQYPASFSIDLAFYQAGTIWIQDIELLYAPAKPRD